ncbi:MAG: DUF3562 domain-containing protein [Actinomycetota bacterium]|nr:DUF3562 domain-containing protein [Actinomycetota bacterium]
MDESGGIDSAAFVRRIIETLSVELGGRWEPETIERVVKDAWRRWWDQARVRRYVPILAERSARERLLALGHDRWMPGDPSAVTTIAPAGRSGS